MFIPEEWLDGRAVNIKTENSDEEIMCHWKSGSQAGGGKWISYGFKFGERGYFSCLHHHVIEASLPKNLNKITGQSWVENVAPLQKRLKAAYSMGNDFVHNPAGAKALHKILGKMASKLDGAVDTLTWKDISTAPEMQTVLIRSEKYPSGNVKIGYLADGTNPDKYGEFGQWMDLERNKIYGKPEYWMHIRK